MSQTDSHATEKLESIPVFTILFAATSIVSTELLKIQLNSTKGGFASTVHFIFTFSCFATPYIFRWFDEQIGESVNKWAYNFLLFYFQITHSYYATKQLLNEFCILLVSSHNKQYCLRSAKNLKNFSYKAEIHRWFLKVT